MGLALAIDYTLLIISRYRDELADGADRDRALVRTMATAGRTVFFSAMTVALSMVAMVLFPMYFLKSFAYAGIAVVMFAAVAAIVVAPAALVLLGDRLDALDVRVLPVESSAGPIRFGSRRADLLVPVHEIRYAPGYSRLVVAIVLLLLVLGAPFLGIKWGFPDDRVLPDVVVDATSRRRTAQPTSRSTPRATSPSSFQTPTASGPATSTATASSLSQVPDVSSVSTRRAARSPAAGRRDRRRRPPGSRMGAGSAAVFEPGGRRRRSHRSAAGQRAARRGHRRTSGTCDGADA